MDEVKPREMKMKGKERAVFVCMLGLVLDDDDHVFMVLCAHL